MSVRTRACLYICVCIYVRVHIYMCTHDTYTYRCVCMYTYSYVIYKYNKLCLKDSFLSKFATMSIEYFFIFYNYYYYIKIFRIIIF